MLRKTARLALLIGVLLLLFKLTGLTQPDVGLADGPVTPPPRPTLTPMPRPTFTPTALPPEIIPTATPLPPIPPPATDEPEHAASPSPTPTLELLLPMAGAERATPIPWSLALLLAGPILFWAAYRSVEDR